MAERHPAWVTGINDFEARLASGALLASSQVGDQLDPLRVRSGIRDAANNPGQVTFSQNKVLVNPFQAVIQDPARPALGAYLVTLDAVKELTLTAADPSLGRIDLVIAEIVQADPGFSVHVVQGQPSASPQPPAVTNPLHLPLARIQVPAGGATPTPTDLRQFTAALSGILPVRSPTDRPAAAPGSQFVYRLDTKVLEVQSGGSWVAYRPPRGSVDTWHPMTLLNGWTNWGNPYTPASYTITEDGWVRLRGLIKSGDPNQAIAVLPTGYRPLYRQLFGVKLAGTSPSVGRLDVLQDGTVLGYSTDGAVSAVYTSLDGLSFATY
jgi:hypothetical protein